MKTVFQTNIRTSLLVLFFSFVLFSPRIVHAIDYNVSNGIYYNNFNQITARNNSGYGYIDSYSGSVDLSGVYWADAIERVAFYTSSVRNVRIPSNITSVGYFAFSKCQYLERVLLESPTCIFNHNTWDGLKCPFDETTCVMYVPEGTGDYFRSQRLGGNVTIIDGFSASGQSFSGSGSGTKDDPYLIFNPIQLNQVRNFLDEKYVHFKLMSDIDLTDWIADNNPYQGWQPIGTDSSPFMGIFDGNHHKITGLRINRSSNDYVGFFGCLLWAVISNLTIDRSEIQGNQFVGTLAGQAISCEFVNCYVSGSLTANGDYSGGLIGCASGNCTDCSSIMTIIGNNSIGGLIGSAFNGQGAELHLENCTSSGVVNGNNNVSLAVGANSRYMFISLMASSGKLISNGSNVGGIVGFSTGGKLEINNSSTIGDIRCAVDKAGGVIGSSGDSIISINNSFSLGDIVCHGSNVGGIAGYVLINGTINNTYYNGIITSNDEYIGGIAGFANNTTIRNCYSYANIIGDSYVGGIAGYAPGATITSNVSICGLVSAISGNVGRIYGSDDLSDVTLGETGTAKENKGLARASVLLNGIPQDVPDGLKHGTNVGSATLKYAATYQGMGWDFNDWTIVETESYPYKPVQCAPPVVTSILEARATEVSGNSIDGGTVTVITSDKEYTAQVTDHQWNVQVDPLQAGSIVIAQADTEDKQPSYFELKTVGFGGSGTEDDPYSIYTAEDLQSINSYKYYRLMADIDLTEWINENNPSSGWIPIGASGNATMKQLDGNGHKITGLWCDNNLENCGLFATTYNATIRDLSLYIAEGKKVKGGTNTGALIGYAEATELDSITVYGDVEGGSNVGGIVGYGNYDSNDQYFSLRKSSLYGDVTGDYYVGGLVGQSAGTLQECYSQGNVTGKGSDCYVGGIVGYNRFLVENCYSNAAVNAGTSSSNSQNQYAGGIVGDNSHTILHCYATGDIFAGRCAAGIAGYNTSTAASVYQCYAMNKRINVASSSGIAMRVIGGIRNGASAPEANNYALKTMVVSVNNIPQTIYDDLLHGQSLTDNVLRQEATYQNNGWDMINVWGIDEDSSYPYLRALNVQHLVERGDIDGDGSVTISDVTGLIDYLLSGNATGVNLESADCDQDGNINISDVTTLIDFLLRGNWR